MLKPLVAEPFVMDIDGGGRPSTALLTPQDPATTPAADPATELPASGAAPALAADDADAPAGLGEASSRTGIAPNGKEHFNIDEAADQLIRSLPGWSGALGQPFTVTYAFRATAPAEMPDDVTGFSRFTSAQIAQVERSLAAWSDVANITFVRVGSGYSGAGAYADNAAMLFANYDDGPDSALAFGYYPGSTDADSFDGDVWVDISLSSNQQPAMGNVGGHALTHEIGHTIGLAHPGEYNAEGDDDVFTYAEDGAYYEDSRQYTVMSYFSERNTGASYNGTYPAGPMLDDIAAAQLEYGANMATRTSDTVYGFNATADRAWFAATSSSSRLVFAIWDAGGKDTLDLSGYSQNQLIDLRPGNFSNAGGLTGNIAIAKGVQIEVARSGVGSDTIYGGQVGSEVFAGGGDDLIVSGGGHTYLRGEDGDDTIAGSSGFDDMNGNKGEDSLSGGGGIDWVLGGQGDDRLFGDDGEDQVYGNLGNDYMEGGAGADTMLGGQANDTILGGTGDDWLSGDRGDDTLTGGAGADIFRSFADAGRDYVTDFNAAEGDRVLVDAGLTYAVAQAGADTVITIGGSATVVLVGVTAASLASGWIFQA